MLDLAERHVIPPAERARMWLTTTLPFWLAHGVDHAGGGFHDVLGFDGRAVRTNKRLRTMARQTWCFATAAREGWCDRDAAEDAVAHGIAFLSEQARSADGGFARTFTFDGVPIDATHDAYDYAFVVLAASAAIRLGNHAALALGLDALQLLERDFHLGPGRGYREIADGGDGTNAAGERRANPHMHLLEAFMAWYGATGDATARAQADDLVALFLERFLDKETWSLREYLDADLNPLADDRDAIREPGHAFEWSWLLNEFDGSSNVQARWTALRLYETARSRGIHPDTGLAYLRIRTCGRPVIETTRSWVQTEALRAAISLNAAPERNMDANVAQHFTTLFDAHIAPAPVGLWHDEIGVADGRVAGRTVPASILYHLVGAFAAVIDAADAPKGRDVTGAAIVAR